MKKLLLVISLLLLIFLGAYVNLKLSQKIQELPTAGANFIATAPPVRNDSLALETILPNPILTPGVTNPNVTQANINQTICVKGWTATIRPGSSYTTTLKVKQIKQYGYKDTSTKSYEEDHFISLELGGHPTAEENLWPESYNTTPNARNKDMVENYLHAQVCQGRITLKEAQSQVVSDWVMIYRNMTLTFGAVSEGVDEDDN